MPERGIAHHLHLRGKTTVFVEHCVVQLGLQSPHPERCGVEGHFNDEGII